MASTPSSGAVLNRSSDSAATVTKTPITNKRKSTLPNAVDETSPAKPRISKLKPSRPLSKRSAPKEAMKSQAMSRDTTELGLSGFPIATDTPSPIAKDLTPKYSTPNRRQADVDGAQSSSPLNRSQEARKSVSFVTLSNSDEDSSSSEVETQKKAQKAPMRKLIKLTDSGDLEIQVGKNDNPYRFLVNHMTLKAVSDKLLNIVTTKVECMRVGGISVTIFPDTDPTALHIILLICHCQFHQLPHRVSFDTLFKLALICQRLDLQELLLPFVRPWLAPYMEHAIDSTRLEWIAISWTFGLEAVFLAYMKHVIRTARSTENIESASSPSKLYDSLRFVAEQRNNLLEALQKLFRRFFNFEDAFRIELSCDCTHGSSECEVQRYHVFCVLVAQHVSIVLSPNCNTSSVDETFAAALDMDIKLSMETLRLSWYSKEAQAASYSEDDLHNEHARCGLSGLKEAIGILLASFEHEFSLPHWLDCRTRNATVNLHTGVGDHIWGSPLGLGADPSTGFIATDLPKFNAFIKFSHTPFFPLEIPRFNINDILSNSGRQRKSLRIKVQRYYKPYLNDSSNDFDIEHDDEMDIDYERELDEELTEPKDQWMDSEEGHDSWDMSVYDSDESKLSSRFSCSGQIA